MAHNPDTVKPWGGAYGHAPPPLHPFRLTSQHILSHPAPYKTSKSASRARPPRRRRSRHRSCRSTTHRGTARRRRRTAAARFSSVASRLTPRDWKRGRWPAMAIPLVLVVLPLGLLFLLSGLTINAVQVAFATGALLDSLPFSFEVARDDLMVRLGDSAPPPHISVVYLKDSCAL